MKYYVYPGPSAPVEIGLDFAEPFIPVEIWDGNGCPVNNASVIAFNTLTGECMEHKRDEDGRIQLFAGEPVQQLVQYVPPLTWRGTVH